MSIRRVALHASTQFRYVAKTVDKALCENLGAYRRMTRLRPGPLQVLDGDGFTHLLNWTDRTVEILRLRPQA